MGLNFLIINTLEFPNDFMLAKIAFSFKTGINYNKITGRIAQIYLLIFVGNCYQKRNELVPYESYDGF